MIQKKGKSNFIENQSKLFANNTGSQTPYIQTPQIKIDPPQIQKQDNNFQENQNDKLLKIFTECSSPISNKQQNQQQMEKKSQFLQFQENQYLHYQSQKQRRHSTYLNSSMNLSNQLGQRRSSHTSQKSISNLADKNSTSNLGSHTDLVNFNKPVLKNDGLLHIIQNNMRDSRRVSNVSNSTVYKIINDINSESQNLNQDNNNNLQVNNNMVQQKQETPCLIQNNLLQIAAHTQQQKQTYTGQMNSSCLKMDKSIQKHNNDKLVHFQEPSSKQQNMEQSQKSNMSQDIQQTQKSLKNKIISQKQKIKEEENQVQKQDQNSNQKLKMLKEVSKKIYFAKKIHKQKKAETTNISKDQQNSTLSPQQQQQIESNRQMSVSRKSGKSRSQRNINSNRDLNKKQVKIQSTHLQSQTSLKVIDVKSEEELEKEKKDRAMMSINLVAINKFNKDLGNYSQSANITKRNKNKLNNNNQIQNTGVTDTQQTQQSTNYETKVYPPLLVSPKKIFFKKKKKKSQNHNVHTNIKDLFYAQKIQHKKNMQINTQRSTQGILSSFNNTQNFNISNFKQQVSNDYLSKFQQNSPKISITIPTSPKQILLTQTTSPSNQQQMKDFYDNSLSNQNYLFGNIGETRQKSISYNSKVLQHGKITNLNTQKNAKRSNSNDLYIFKQFADESQDSINISQKELSYMTGSEDDDEHKKNKQQINNTKSNSMLSSIQNHTITLDIPKKSYPSTKNRSGVHTRKSSIQQNFVYNSLEEFFQKYFQQQMNKVFNQCLQDQELADIVDISYFNLQDIIPQYMKIFRGCFIDNKKDICTLDKNLNIIQPIVFTNKIFEKFYSILSTYLLDTDYLEKVKYNFSVLKAQHIHCPHIFFRQFSSFRQIQKICVQVLQEIPKETFSLEDPYLSVQNPKLQLFFIFLMDKNYKRAMELYKEFMEDKYKTKP